METTQGLYIFTVKQVHMNHIALLWQRSELRRPARCKLGDESADTAEWSDVGDPVESAFELTINADYPRCSARGVLQRVRGERDWFLGVQGSTSSPDVSGGMASTILATSRLGSAGTLSGGNSRGASRFRSAVLLRTGIVRTS